MLKVKYTNYYGNNGGCLRKQPPAVLFLRSFTLVELVMVIVIVGVLASLAIPGYFKARQKAIDREAQAMLRLLQSAQKIYKLENEIFTNCANTLDCNTKLRLDLSDNNWSYNVTAANNVDFIGKAVVQPGKGSQNWCIEKNSDPHAC